MADPALYLHIGRNKAGSTSLQAFFASHTQWLAAHRMRYALFGHAEAADGAPLLRNHRAMIAHFRAEPGQSLLISNELISAFSADLAAAMAADLAAVNVQVIYYVRPYRAWVRSSYGFDVRTGCNGRDFDAYLTHISPAISFWPTLRIWGDTLGWHRVRVRSTDPRDLVGGDLVQDCLAAMQVPLPGHIAVPRGNVTPPWMVIELLRLIKGADDRVGWDHAGLATAAALHQLMDESLATCLIADPAAEYLTRRQSAWLAELYNRDLDALHDATGVRLQPDDAEAAGDRGFLPDASHIPRRVLHELAARAANPAFIHAHPEAAAFVAAPPFAALLHRQAIAANLVPPQARPYTRVMDIGVGDSAIPHPAAARAHALAADGQLHAAIDAATEALRAQPDAALFAALAQWRVDAFGQTEAPPGPDSWPRQLPDPFPGVDGIPVITAAELTADILGGAILHHGSLRVNGLVCAAEAEALREGIDRALAARDEVRAGHQPADPGWYVPLDAPPLRISRGWVESGGAVWTADCPPMLFRVIDAFTRAGVIDRIAELMGQRPALSVGKSTLRRVPGETGTDWHQDGAFLGRDVRSVNVWLALSACGVDAPGLDVVGRRLPYVLQTGSHGASFDWSVGPGMLDILAEGGAPILAPEFGPGDALLFDHMMLHRTGVRPGMTRNRWAIESWFFAPTHYPADQVPLVV